MELGNEDEGRTRRAIDLFEEELHKRLHSECDLVRDAELKTRWGPLSVPLLAVRQGHSVAFDFYGLGTVSGSGSDFRHGLLLGSGVVRVIYWLRAHDVLTRCEDVLYGVSLWEPRLFSDRGRDIVERNSSHHMNDLVRERGWPPSGREDSYSALFEYPSEGDKEPEDLKMERHALRRNGRDYWSECFQFAERHGGETFEEVKAAWDNASSLLP